MSTITAVNTKTGEPVELTNEEPKNTATVDGILEPIVGEVFIIPNSTGFKHDFFTHVQKRLTRSEALNDLDPSLDHEYVQVWIHTPDTDNLCAHGIKTADIFGNEVYLAGGSFIEHLPIDILDGKREGDTISFSDIVPTWHKPNEPGKKYLACLKLTLKQKGYRYGSFGTFDEVLEKVRKH